MSLLQLGFSALAALALFILALILAIVGAFELVNSDFASVDATRSMLLAYSLGMMGILCLPSVGTSLLRLLKKPANTQVSELVQGVKATPVGQRWDAFTIVSILMVVILPPCLLAGHWVAQNESYAWLALPPINIIATGLPVLWLALLGMRKLQGGSAQRTWGVFTCGLAYGSLTILVAEIALLGVVGVLALIWVSSQPELYRQLLELIERIRALAVPDQEELFRLMQPYVGHPVMVTGLFLIAAVFVPLIEELFKPIGVWLLAWKKLSPAEGWVAGVISGAAFALFENLGNTSGGGEQWAVVTASRIVAALLHMLTSGLMGWAIAAAWTKRRTLRLVVVYLLAVTIHGLWNGLAILGSVALPVDLPLTLSSEIPAASVVSVIGLVALCSFNFVLYLMINRSLRPKQDTQVSGLVTP